MSTVCITQCITVDCMKEVHGIYTEVVDGMTGQNGQLAQTNASMALRQDLDNVTIHHHSMEETTVTGQIVRKGIVSTNPYPGKQSPNSFSHVSHQVMLFTACFAIKHRLNKHTLDVFKLVLCLTYNIVVLITQMEKNVCNYISL